MANIKTLALRSAAVEQLADAFDESQIPFTCAAVVIGHARPLARTLCEGTGWSADFLALRAADEVHRRRAATLETIRAAMGDSYLEVVMSELERRSGRNLVDGDPSLPAHKGLLG